MAKGFKHGAGGVGLNFKVVGNPQPSNPKENTIWVNTDQKITGWVFSATQPTNPTEGMVWILTGTSSPVVFNALKKDGIQVYPIYAKQYVSGSWVGRAAKSNQGGKWVEWIRYLYRIGDECMNITGGWVSKGAKKSSSSSSTALAPTINRYNNYIYAGITSENRSGVFYARKQVKLEGYSKLVAEGEFFLDGSAGAANLSLYIWTELGTYYGENVVASVFGPVSVVNKKLEIDLTGFSDLSGEYTIGFLINTANGNNGYIKLTKCYLEG